MRRGTPIAAALVIQLALMAPGRSARAAEIVVTTTADELDVIGGCSLREAVRAANLNVRQGPCAAGSDTSTDTIVLAAGATYTLELAGTNDALTGDLDIHDNAASPDVVIRVADDGTATIGQTVNDRVLQVESRASVEIYGVTISGGVNLPSQGMGASEPLGKGGGIANAGALTLVDCAVLENVAETQGGGIYNGPAGASLRLSETDVGRNQVPTTRTGEQEGGGIYNDDESSLTVEGGQFFQNSAFTGGGIHNGSLADATLLGGTMVGAKSSFSANQAFQGGGIFNARGGVLVMVDGTVASNSAVTDGGGIFNLGGLTLARSVVENNSTSGSGGGIGNFGELIAGATRISGNVALIEGGGLMNRNVAEIEDGSAIESNVAVGGGGIFSSGPLRIDSTRIAFNAASTGGGISQIAGGDPEKLAVVTNTVLRANRGNPRSTGGALFVGDPSGLALSDGCLIDNDLFTIDGAEPQSATGSWWGDPLGPGGTEGFGIDISGFLTAPPPGCGDELVSNGEMSLGADGREDGTGAPFGWRSNIGGLTAPDGVVTRRDGDRVVKLSGDGRKRKLIQTITGGGHAGDTFSFSARSSASQLSEGGSHFVAASIIYRDGTKQAFRLKFSPFTHDEEVRSRGFTARADYRKIRIVIQLAKGSGSASFDDVSLIRE
jgi:CSLREA domain-containing protein